MNFIALGLLRAMESEEMAFWTLGGLASAVLPGYYTASMSGTQIDMKIMAQLVMDYLPEVHAHLTAVECPLELMLTQWLLPIFITTLPPTCTFQIWDWLFVEGCDTLLMVAISFLSLCQDEIVQCGDFADVATFFAEKPAEVYKAEPLLERARQFYADIGKGKIVRMRAEMKVKVASAGEEQNQQRLVRQMVKETHLTEEDVQTLHQKFMEMEQKQRSQSKSTKSAGPAAGAKKRGRRASIGGKLREKLDQRKDEKTDLAALDEAAIYEDREIDFDGFRELIHNELPQWGAGSDEEQLRQLFSAFDDDGNGSISVQEFISGLAVFTGGSVDNKLRLIFRTTDADDSGRLDMDEMLKLFEDCYRLFYPGMNRMHVADGPGPPGAVKRPHHLPP
jgi:Ca2+-binding EF-hand superfamily protein